MTHVRPPGESTVRLCSTANSFTAFFTPGHLQRHSPHENPSTIFHYPVNLSEAARPPPLPSRNSRTRLVPLPVLTGHVSARTPAAAASLAGREGRASRVVVAEHEAARRKQRKEVAHVRRHIFRGTALQKSRRNKCANDH
jgi:hypothetical protein